MTKTKKHIVIVGGGFGGVKAAELLAHNQAFKVTLISDRPDFWYYPSLYRTATGTTSELSAIPLSSIFKNRPVDVVIDQAVSVNRDKRQLKLQSGKNLGYDSLVLALGMITNYFGIEGLAEFSYGIKSIKEAEELKSHLHRLLQKDSIGNLNCVVVGGGPTGIELAGQLPEYLRYIMNKHGIKNRAVHVSLVEAAPHLMPRLPKRVGRTIERRLRSLGIKLYLGKTVKGETYEALNLEDRSLDSQTVIWTAGQANNPFFTDNNFNISEHHKVVVDSHLQASEDIYVIGDNADTQYSGMAQTAISDAEYIAEHLTRQVKEEPLKDYKPRKPIYVTPAGRHWAYVVWGNLHLHGMLGWLLREAGDMKGFLDIESPLEAGEQWIKGYQTEDACSICD